MCEPLQAQLGSPPVSSHGVAPAFVTSYQLYPLGKQDDFAFVSWSGIA